MSSSPRDEYVVGIDRGTFSGRVVVCVTAGAELGSATHDYSTAVNS